MKGLRLLMTAGLYRLLHDCWTFSTRAPPSIEPTPCDKAVLDAGENERKWASAMRQHNLVHVNGASEVRRGRSEFSAWPGDGDLRPAQRRA